MIKRLRFCTQSRFLVTLSSRMKSTSALATKESYPITDATSSAMEIDFRALPAFIVGRRIGVDSSATHEL